MLTITKFATEGLEKDCVTDRRQPRFTYTLQSDGQNVSVKKATIQVGSWKADASDQLGITYGGEALQPYTSYTAKLSVETNNGDRAQAQTTFRTGKLDDPWKGVWISDPSYSFTEKKVSPVPMVFRKVLTLGPAQENGSVGRDHTSKNTDSAAGSFSVEGKGVAAETAGAKAQAAGAPMIQRAEIYATAMGVYTLALDGERVGGRYLAPGFTSYKTNLEYQVYDVTDMLKGKTSALLTATVAGGWAVGSFVFTRVNRQAADRQALLLEVRITYADGSVQVIGSDGSFEVTEEGPVRMADLYDGETYDAGKEANLTAGLFGLSQPRVGKSGLNGAADDALNRTAGAAENASRDDTGNRGHAADHAGTAAGAGVGDPSVWHAAAPETLRVSPKIQADYGCPVVRHEHMLPQDATDREDGSVIYNYGQNFAGITELKVTGAKAGDKITVRHAELLNKDGSLNVKFLRTAQQTFTCILKDGDETLAPDFTYMGFQYVQVQAERDGKPLGARWIHDHVEVSAWALYSDLRSTGDFTCSNEMLNRLQQNITWGARSNFVDIPTDCPQRDERMGWTGDINVFSPTACWNFDMDRFLEKWLQDVKAEQLKTGGIPNTVPVNGYGFPATMPEMAIDWWGDACVSVPWNLYRAYGDETILREMYPVMKKYVNACSFWAKLCSFGKNRYIWNTPSTLHFGDWVAPDVPKMSQWQGRARWTATASIVRTSAIVARAAAILGEKEDEKHYQDLSDKTADAYATVLMDGNGKLVGQQFQTGYVLPIYFNMLHGEAKTNAVNNLVEMVEKNDYKIGTGFPGTPYILFALADNGRTDVAYKMLLNTQCPSWLYEVKMGATTIWERWDGLDENGECPIGDDGTDIMISYNHYASGAVGDFFYRRIAGVEMTAPGYRTFTIKPVRGGSLTHASAHVDTPFGRITSCWKIDKAPDGHDQFTQTIDVPVGTVCELTLPSGKTQKFGSGHYTVIDD